MFTAHEIVCQSLELDPKFQYRLKKKNIECYRYYKITVNSTSYFFMESHRESADYTYLTIAPVEDSDDIPAPFTIFAMLRPFCFDLREADVKVLEEHKTIALRFPYPLKYICPNCSKKLVYKDHKMVCESEHEFPIEDLMILNDYHIVV